MMNNSTHEFERLLGNAALALWSDLPRDVQESLFETAMAVRIQVARTTDVRESGGYGR